MRGGATLTPPHIFEKEGNALNNQNKAADGLAAKALSRLVLVSMLGMLILVLCLCSTTWAWFSADVSNGSNTLGSGKFALRFTVRDQDGAEVTILPAADGSSSCVLSKVGVYTVTLQITEDTTVSKGYCMITTNECSYKTATVKQEMGTFSFSLETRENDLTVLLTPAWGTPAEADVQPGATLFIGP